MAEEEDNTIPMLKIRLKEDLVEIEEAIASESIKKILTSLVRSRHLLMTIFYDMSLKNDDREIREAQTEERLKKIEDRLGLWTKKLQAKK